MTSRGVPTLGVASLALLLGGGPCPISGSTPVLARCPPPPTGHWIGLGDTPHPVGPGTAGLSTEPVSGLGSTPPPPAPSGAGIGLWTGPVKGLGVSPPPYGGAGTRGRGTPSPL